MGLSMSRREFLGVLGNAAVVWPLSARAQQPDGMRRIDVLAGLAEDDANIRARLAALREGLARRRWSEGAISGATTATDRPARMRKRSRKSLWHCSPK